MHGYMVYLPTIPKIYQYGKYTYNFLPQCYGKIYHAVPWDPVGMSSPPEVNSVFLGVQNTEPPGPWWPWMSTYSIGK